MPALRSKRQEAFARLIAEGHAPEAAHAAASCGGPAHAALRLAARADVVARIAELRRTKQPPSEALSPAIAGVDRSWVLAQLAEIAGRAMRLQPALDREGRPTGTEQYDGKLALAALNLIGKELGMFAERRDAEPRGLFDGMTMEEKRERAIDLARQLGLERLLADD